MPPGYSSVHPFHHYVHDPRHRCCLTEGNSQEAGMLVSPNRGVSSDPFWGPSLKYNLLSLRTVVLTKAKVASLCMK
jgi:hypothetical protein